MIDWDKSAELNNCTIGDLKSRFERFPSSGKRIITICNNCGDVREVSFSQYRNLCQKCSLNTPQAIWANSERQIQYNIDNPEARGIRVKKIIQYHIDNPGVFKGAGRGSRWGAGRILDSDALDNRNETMRGGHDIVDHHMIYDHSDLSKNIMPMTRSMHTKLHRLFQKHGIIIPHINIMN